MKSEILLATAPTQLDTLEETARKVCLALFSFLEFKTITNLLRMFTQTTRPVAMGWHVAANATPGQEDTRFLPPLQIFLQLKI